MSKLIAHRKLSKALVWPNVQKKVYKRKFTISYIKKLTKIKYDRQQPTTPTLDNHIKSLVGLNFFVLLDPPTSWVNQWCKHIQKKTLKINLLCIQFHYIYMENTLPCIVSLVLLCKSCVQTFVFNNCLFKKFLPWQMFSNSWFPLFKIIQGNEEIFRISLNIHYLPFSILKLTREVSIWHMCHEKSWWWPLRYTIYRVAQF